MMKIKRFAIAHLPWILMMAAISVQSSISDIALPDIGFDPMDKLVHFVVFGFLGILMVRGFHFQPLVSNKLTGYILIIILGILFSAIDEWHQSFVPGRYADIWDWAADTAGIIVFSLILFYIYNRKGFIPEKKP
ncbi:MAG: VanZ family protein [Calditrichaceae bacterium]|nr:VanZ family protein [Calditrichaceae bacterium]MBN2707895.1 VanZ family protein [Calditrichaceae bacterium]RQV97842.1 MAG: hypothetical protein EH224_00100 [Calditrichota bacterium]